MSECQNCQDQILAILMTLTRVPAILYLEDAQGHHSEDQKPWILLPVLAWEIVNSNPLSWTKMMELASGERQLLLTSGKMIFEIS